MKCYPGVVHIVHVHPETYGEMIQFELLFFAIGVFNWNSLPFPKGSTIGTVPNSVWYLQLVTFAKWQAGNGTWNGEVTSWVYPRPTIQKEGNEQSHSGTRFHESLGGGTFEHFIACYQTRHSPNCVFFLLMEKIQLPRWDWQSIS